MARSHREVVILLIEAHDQDREREMEAAWERLTDAEREAIEEESRKAAEAYDEYRRTVLHMTDAEIAAEDAYHNEYYAEIERKEGGR